MLQKTKIKNKIECTGLLANINASALTIEHIHNIIKIYSINIYFNLKIFNIGESGLEPLTHGFSDHCSTPELHTYINF